MTFGEKLHSSRPRIEYRIHPDFWKALYFTCVGKKYDTNKPPYSIGIVDFTGWLSPMIVAAQLCVPYIAMECNSARLQYYKTSEFLAPIKLLGTNANIETLLEFAKLVNDFVKKATALESKASKAKKKKPKKNREDDEDDNSSKKKSKKNKEEEDEDESEPVLTD
jgi:hypothetical protein